MCVCGAGVSRIIRVNIFPGCPSTRHTHTHTHTIIRGQFYSIKAKECAKRFHQAVEEGWGIGHPTTTRSSSRSTCEIFCAFCGQVGLSAATPGVYILIYGTPHLLAAGCVFAREHALRERAVEITQQRFIT